MESNKVNGSQHEMLEMVIKELVEEQIKINQTVGNVVTSVNDLRNKLSGIAKKLEEPTATAVNEVDIMRIEQMVDKGIFDIRLIAAENFRKSKPNNFQVFLESDAKK